MIIFVVNKNILLYKLRMHILYLLFFEFFKIALFTIGGGLVMIPVIENTFVKKHKLLKESDIIDMVGITQIVPGLIAINSACFVGHKLAGRKGAFTATFAVILPSMIIIMIIAVLFPLENLSNLHLLQAFQCIRACVLGMFILLACRIGKKVLRSYIDLPLAFLLLALLVSKINSVWIIFISCVSGALYEVYIRSKLMGKKK